MNIQSKESVEIRKERKITLIREELKFVSCYTFSSIRVVERIILIDKDGDDKIHDISE